jgi:AraC-like DNA-binding protein
MGDAKTTSFNSLEIGLVMDFFNPQLLEGAKAYTMEKDIRLDARWSVRGDWLPDKLRWNGILCGMIDQSKNMRSIRSLQLPTLDLLEDRGTISVIPDYRACGKLMVQELLEYGSDKILIAKLSQFSLDDELVRGACEEARITGVAHQKFSTANQGFNQLVQDLVKVIIAHPKPFGLCLAHAGVAYTLTQELLAKEIRVPEDVAIIVMDKDVQQTSSLAPVPLTGVVLDDWHRGFVAAEILHQHILGHPPKQHCTRIPPRGIQKRTSTGHANEYDPTMAKALIYLRKNHLKEIGVPEIVQASGVSRRVLEVKFRKTLNRSILEELLRLRIEDAKQHLTENKLRVTDVALLCGFSSVYYFSRAFKRETGVSPKQYQKRIHD